MRQKSCVSKISIFAWIFQIIRSFVCPRLQYSKSAQLVEFLQNIWKREEPNILGSDLVRVETRRALTDIQHIVCRKYRQGKTISKALRISRVEGESLKWGRRLWRLRSTKLQTEPMTVHFLKWWKIRLISTKKTKTNCTVLQQHNHLDGFVICGALERLRVDGDRYCEALPSAGPANKPARSKLFSRFLWLWLWSSSIY